jgi:hypothetical protein
MGNNPQTVLGAAIFCFAIALVSSVRNNASSFSDLDVVGKFFCTLMCILFVYLVYMVFFKKK